MRSRLALSLAVLLALALLGPGAASAHDEADGTEPPEEITAPEEGAIHDPSDQLEALDAHSNDIINTMPYANVTNRLGLVGRGDRNAPNSTTDVWTLGNYAYLGTFQSPCGTGEGYGSGALVDGVEGPGIPVFNIQDKTNPVYVGNIPSVAGSRINDVKAMSMNQGDILVHSNESCDGGPGGFEVYDVSNPETPILLTHVQTDDINQALREGNGFVDFGVHNNYLFTRDGRDYNAVQVESLLGNFQVFDITDTDNVTLAGWYGAEYLFDDTIDWATTTDFDAIVAAQTYLLSGFGDSANRFLHDQYVTDDGTQAYLANWDAGLILLNLDALDGSAFSLVSVAIDPTSEDGEVNSHSVWPNEDGSVVAEGEEDFNPFTTIFSITTGPSAGEYAASEGSITVPINSLPGQRMGGPTRYVGLACTGGDPVPPAGSADEVALIQRGVCSFTDKITNADAAGYAGVVVFNDEARGDALVTMGGDAVNLPGVFVGHSTGLAIAGAPDAASLVIGDTGETVSVDVIPNGWSGVRIWDYADPANPILASTFNTICSSNPIDASCDPRGTYSSHNVQIEGNKLYISWYTEGVIVLDISDPYNPTEVARYHRAGAAFEAENHGIQDIWGIYKPVGSRFIYASDRNGGLYILKLRATQTLTCFGQEATGAPTAGNDVLIGTNGSDTIDGLGGNDLICGRGGDDTLIGGDGNDRIDGGEGADTINGGIGDDRIIGGPGNDYNLLGGDGHDVIRGGAGDDTYLDGGAGNDNVNGGDGNDSRIMGGPGNDRVSGGIGDDQDVRGQAGNDIVSGGPGNDRLLLGNAGDDTVNGNAGDDNRLVGGQGTDTVNGGAGSNTLCSGETVSNCV